MSEVLRRIDYWRRAIALDLAHRNPQLTPSQIDSAAQHLITSILCLHLGAARSLFSDSQLQTLHHSADVPAQLGYLLQTVFGSLLQPGFALKLRVDIALLLNAIQNLKTEAIAVSTLAQAYEQSLGESSLRNPNPRKTGGIFYTPPAIVNYAVECTIGTKLAKAAAMYPAQLPYILDPACGGGAFLLGAYQALLDWQLEQCIAAIANPSQHPQSALEARSRLCQTATGKWQLTFAERSRILVTYIYGVDIDPCAVEVTQLSLLLKLLSSGFYPVSEALPNLEATICCGNALIGSDFRADEFPLQHQTSSDVKPFEWGNTFPNVMRSGGFDVVIGNPPYIDAECMTASLPHWRRYCATRYETAAGNWDIFCVFIEKALQLCKPGGLVSFVVPNKLASADYAAKARSLLTQSNQLLSIRNYCRVAPFAAGVYPLVFVAHKGRLHQQSHINYELMDIKEDKAMCEAGRKGRSLTQPLDNVQVCQTYKINYDRFVSLPEQPWLISTSPAQSDLVTRLSHSFPALDDVAQVTGAATVAEAYAIQPLIQDCQTLQNGDLKLVNSGTIDRYQFRWGEKRLRYLKNMYQYPVIARSHLHHLSPKRQQQATHPKIIVAGMTKGLECALDKDGAMLAAKSTSVIRSAIDLRYLLGLLNSQLIQIYFTSRFSGNSLQGGYLRVGPPQLKHIPIRLLDSNSADDQRYGDRIIALVDQIMSFTQQLAVAPASHHPTLQQQIASASQEIDHITYTLYGLSDLEIDAVTAIAPEAYIATEGLIRTGYRGGTPGWGRSPHTPSS